MSKNLGMNEVWWVEIEASQSEVGDKEREGMKMEWARRERERKGMKWSGKKEREYAKKIRILVGIFYLLKNSIKKCHMEMYERV